MAELKTAQDGERAPPQHGQPWITHPNQARQGCRATLHTRPEYGAQRGQYRNGVARPRPASASLKLSLADQPLGTSLHWRACAIERRKLISARKYAQQPDQ